MWSPTFRFKCFTHCLPCFCLRSSCQGQNVFTPFKDMHLHLRNSSCSVRLLLGNRDCVTSVGWVTGQEQTLDTNQYFGRGACEGMWMRELFRGSVACSAVALNPGVCSKNTNAPQMLKIVNMPRCKMTNRTGTGRTVPDQLWRSSDPHIS